MLAQVDKGDTPFASLCVAILMACAAVVLGGCNRSNNADKATCIADSLGSLRLLSSVPDCATGDWVCRIKCEFGDEASCLGLAYSAQRDSKTPDEARELFRRACLLGAGNACTNTAAGIWIRDSSDEQLECARRTFERACSAREPFACGMVGRVMLESMTPPLYSQGRHHLEKACDEVGGFSCRVLAMHLESGKLGEYQPELIQKLLSRACRGGDPDACGTHATASETFQ
jgi:hypothetical protein